MSDIDRLFEEESRSASPRPRRPPPSFFWPLVLIGAGVLLLLSNLGYLPWQSWNLLWRLWPLLLIALGIDVLFGRRSMVGAIFSGLLILLLIGSVVFALLFAQNIPGLVSLTQPPEWRTRHIEHPLGDVERASVDIDWSSVPGALSASDDSPNLIEGTVVYRENLVFDVTVHDDDYAEVKLDTYTSGPWTWTFGFEDRAERRWDLKLSPNVPLDLVLDAGSGPCDLDLSGLQLSALLIDSGSGPIDLTLPSGSTFEARIDGGSSPLDIVLPRGMGARVVLDSGSGPFNPDERFQLVSGDRDGDGIWETEGFDTADYTVELIIDQSSGPIRIH
jgi:hypothetical protein